MSPYDVALQRLRDSGHRITDARRAVLRCLYDAGGHLTSSDVIEQVVSRDDRISRASVFRALELLTTLALIRPTFLEARTPTYVLMSSEGHHAHILCTGCGNVIELEECIADGFEGEMALRHGVRLTGHLLEFYGLCERCLHTPPAEENPALQDD